MLGSGLAVALDVGVGPMVGSSNFFFLFFYWADGRLLNYIYNSFALILPVLLLEVSS